MKFMNLLPRTWTIVVLTSLLFSTSSYAKLIPHDDPGIRYFGRTVYTPGGQAHSWPGCGWEAEFTGTSISIEISGNHVNYDVWLDGQLQSPIVAGDATNTYFVASSLFDVTHTIRVAQRSEHFGQFSYFQGFHIDESATVGVKLPAWGSRIEFIGDSYTVGYGNEGASDLRAQTNTNKAFPVLVANSLGSEYNIVAWSGKGMVKNYGGTAADVQTVPYYYPDALATAGGSPWDFSLYTPDLVVICLGTNDFSTEPWPTEEEYSTGYKDFIDLIKGNHPDVKILCVSTDWGFHDQYLQTIVSDKNADYPGDIYYTAFPGGLQLTGMHAHPNLVDHQNIANTVLAAIDGIDDWREEAPPEIGEWSMDDCEIGSDQDQLVLQGNTSQVADQVFGSAIQSAGSGLGDVVTVAGSANSFPQDGDPSLSVEAWVKFDAGSTGDECIAHKNTIAFNSGFLLHRDANKKLAFYANSPGFAWYGVTSTFATIPDEEWTHVAGTWNADDNQLRVWINGVQVGAQWVAGMFISDNSEPVRLMNRHGLAMSFKGMIDEFKITSEAIDYSSLNIVPNAQPPVWSSSTLTKADAEVNIDYLATGTILSADVTGLNGTPLTYTIKCDGPEWLKVDPETGALSGSPTEYDLGLNTFLLSASDGSSSSNVTVNITVNPGTNLIPTWNSDPVITLDAAEGFPYFDSLADEASDPNPGDTLTFAKVDGPDWLTVASDGTLGGAPGDTDSGINIFTVTVSDGLYTPVPGVLKVSVTGSSDPDLLGYWSMDPCDFGSSNGELEAVGGVSQVSGQRFGNAISSDGAYGSYYRVVGSAGNENYFPDNWIQVGPSLTVEAWVYFNDDGGGCILEKTDAYYTGYALHRGANKQLEFYCGDAGTQYQHAYSGEANPIPTGEWTHIAGTYDSATYRMKVWINGVEVGSNQWYGMNLQDPTPQQLNIMDRAPGFGDPMNGMVDEVKITARVVDFYQIAAMSSQGEPPIWTSGTVTKANATIDQDYTVKSASIDSGDVIASSGDQITSYDIVCGPAWLQIAPLSGVLFGTPSTSDIGLNTFTVSVTDDDASSTATLNINVVAGGSNNPPSWNSSPVSKLNATEDAAYSASLSGDATDGEGDTLTFTKTSGPSWLIVASNGALGGTPGSANVGGNTFGVTVSDGVNSAVAVTLLITVDAAPDPYDDWKSATFANPGDANTGRADDYDGDGLTNEFEYMFAMDPENAGNARMPHTSIVDNGGSDHLAVTYVREIGSSISYEFRTSTDLSNWSTWANVGTEMVPHGTPSANPDGITETVTVRYQLNLNSDSKRFIQVRASE